MKTAARYESAVTKSIARPKVGKSSRRFPRILWDACDSFRSSIKQRTLPKGLKKKDHDKSGTPFSERVATGWLQGALDIAQRGAEQTRRGRSVLAIGRRTSISIVYIPWHASANTLMQRSRSHAYSQFRIPHSREYANVQTLK